MTSGDFFRLGFFACLGWVLASKIADLIEWVVGSMSTGVLILLVICAICSAFVIAAGVVNKRLPDDP
jgi:hypothetical protein